MDGVCVERMAEKRKAYRALVGKPERRSLLRRSRLNGSIILKWVLKK